jgi:hypothetical protein
MGDLDDNLRPEYDLTKLSKPIRGKYVKRLGERKRLIVLEPDVARKFPDAQSVNDALRLLMKNPKSRVRRAA